MKYSNRKLFVERGTYTIANAFRIVPAVLNLAAGREGSGFIPCTREELMLRSGILGRTLYYKCLRDLAVWGGDRVSGGEDAGRSGSCYVITYNTIYANKKLDEILTSLHYS
jgi:hypothetical protein